ncbi:unnamed protein product [Clonostachys rosea]|uniref:Uncharacterized protein n=1 Tax=Bionectria ochroleuca TaxID=29856 RepID=A0ABY6TPY3_BIOOC|nr:unnamed protein product [Clonostachys rosea]
MASARDQQLGVGRERCFGKLFKGGSSSRTKRGKVGVDQERIDGWSSGVATEFRAVLDATF